MTGTSGYHHMDHNMRSLVLHTLYLITLSNTVQLLIIGDRMVFNGFVYLHFAITFL